MNKPSCPVFVRSFCIMVVAQLVLAGLVTHFVPLSVRPLVMVSLTVILMMVVAAFLDIPRWTKVATVVFSTATSIVCVYAWRRYVDSMGFFGPIPAAFEIPALGVSAILTILFGALAAIVSHRDSRLYRVRWAFVIFASLIVVGGLFVLSASQLETSSLVRLQLQQVLLAEAHLDSLTPFERQQLSFWLGVLGRSPEDQAFSTIGVSASSGNLPIDDSVKWNPGSSMPVEWREAVGEIAARERIVIIMEAHNAPEHREWIEQTLPIFYQAGFRHYAAEALNEAGDALTRRGYPVQSTGFYVADPRFGNLLRRAIELNFVIHEYEAHLASEILHREEQQAQTLANIISANPDCKIVIHVGYAHSFKQPVPGVGKWMAARLWEKTGIEPYCIYQGHAEYDSPGYPQLVELAGATDEPKMLIPIPSGLPGLQFAGIPARAVDSLVIHPVARSRPPVAREPVFSSGMTQIWGRWMEREWPVVIGAYRVGEPTDAIALDQVMLRQGEPRFDLWIPAQPYELRVTSPSGDVNVDVESNGNEFQLQRAVTSREH